MKQDKQVAVHPLAQFAATLKWDDVPEAVQCKAEDLWVDWFGSVLARCKALRALRCRKARPKVLAK